MLLQEQVSGEFLQVGGVAVAADPNAAVGQRVRSLTLDGADGPLDLTDDRTAVALVSNSYVMTGGGYGPLGEVDLLAEIGGDLETIEAYVNGWVGGTGGCLAGYAGTRGRICFGCDGYEPAPWVATVRVVAADGAPVADRPAWHWSLMASRRGAQNRRVPDWSRRLTLTTTWAMAWWRTACVPGPRSGGRVGSRHPGGWAVGVGLEGVGAR